MWCMARLKKVRGEGQVNRDPQEKRPPAERRRLLQSRGRGQGAQLCRPLHRPR